MDLATRYLGLDLPNPFIMGASPLIFSIDSVRELEAAGTAAVVMHSLYEEQIARELGEESAASASTSGPYAQASQFPLQPAPYLEHIKKLKEAVSMPVIASLNGIHHGPWVEYAAKMEEAGADALELNLYSTPHSHLSSSQETEEKLLKTVRGVRQCTGLPLAIKLTPYYTSLPSFIASLEAEGVQSVVLFNTFMQTDIDIESVSYRTNVTAHEPHALLLRTHWMATLHDRYGLDFSVLGGINSPEDALKGLMAGATTVQIVSFILNNGPTFLTALIDIVIEWMELRGYDSVEDIRGILSYKDSEDPGAATRTGYLKYLQSWKPKD